MIYPVAQIFSPPIASLLGTSLGSPNDEKLRALWECYLISAKQHLFVHSARGEVIGLIGIEQRKGQPTVILHLAVAPHHQRTGIGRRMIEQISAESLVVETDNSAVNFYRRCGFSVRSLGEKFPGVERFECMKSNAVLSSQPDHS